MKVFVSGQIDDIDYVRSIQEAFIAAGYTITHDWTRNETGDKYLAGRQAKLDNPDETAKRAILDMNGVINSDIYVVCTDNERVGKGMYVELGGAIALSEKTGSPNIYLLGDMNHMSIFYFHPKVRRVGSVQEILRLEKSPLGSDNKDIRVV